MSLEINYSDLNFHRPSTALASRTLKIRNSNFDPVAFKVKTSDFKLWSVTPNKGYIQPWEDLEVKISLEPLSAKTECRGKFLVQSFVQTSPSTTLVWEDAAEGTEIHEQKICVNFITNSEVPTSTLIASASQPCDPTYEELKEKLAEAEIQIAKLQLEVSMTKSNTQSSDVKEKSFLGIRYKSGQTRKQRQ